MTKKFNISFLSCPLTIWISFKQIGNIKVIGNIALRTNLIPCSLLLRFSDLPQSPSFKWSSLSWICEFELNWLFNVTINDISVIYVTAHPVQRIPGIGLPALYRPAGEVFQVFTRVAAWGAITCLKFTYLIIIICFQVLISWTVAFCHFFQTCNYYVYVPPYRNAFPYHRYHRHWGFQPPPALRGPTGTGTEGTTRHRHLRETAARYYRRAGNGIHTAIPAHTDVPAY